MHVLSYGEHATYFSSGSTYGVRYQVRVLAAHKDDSDDLALMYNSTSKRNSVGPLSIVSVL